MICVKQVKVSPGRINIKTGQSYSGLTVQVSPQNATNPKVKWSSSNPKVVYINANNGTLLGRSEGTATVYATAQDDSGKMDCCTVVVSKSIPVSHITLGSTNLHLETNRTITTPSVKIYPENADNKTVRWCSDNPNVVTVDNEGLHTHAEGRATITVTATDGSGVSAYCKVTVYKTIYVSSVTVDASSKVMRTGESVYLHATVCPVNATDKRIMWLSSDEDVATVNPISGLVTAQGPGTAIIYAESLDNSGRKDSCTVTVKQKIPLSSIRFDRTEISLRPGDCYKLSITLCPTNATDKSLLWYSNNPDAATVRDGVIHAKSVGYAEISASPTGGTEKPIVAVCKVLVSNYTPVSSVTVSPSDKAMTVGDSTYLHATVCPEDATNKWIEWKSSNEAVATVQADSGLVIAQGPGTATIFAMTLEGMGVSGSCTVTVQDVVPVRSVMVCPSSKCIRVGESDCLTATVYPRGATNKSVHWYSDNPDVATVTRTTGVVTGQSDGTATITAITVDGGFVSSCTVTVDSREVVTIEEDGYDVYGFKYFNVQFSNGMVWKSVSCDPFDENDDDPVMAKSRYNENCAQSETFSATQLALIYLFDPIGVEVYVSRQAERLFLDQIDMLFFKDQLYETIFGVKPQFFSIKLNGETEWHSPREELTREFRNEVYSQAELLFGAHRVATLQTLTRFSIDLLGNIFGNITGVSDILTGIELGRALFFAGAIKGICSDAASNFIKSCAAETYGVSVSTQIFNWPSALFGALKSVNAFLAPPKFNELPTYRKVDSNYYSTHFRIEGADYTMKDIIARYEAY